MTQAQLRRRIERAVHELTGDMEPWRHVERAMEFYLGPSVGMVPGQRWRDAGAVELMLLCWALEERAALAEGQAKASFWWPLEQRRPSRRQTRQPQIPADPIVVNRHHYRDKPIPQPWRYIGRGTPLGNPYTLKEHGSHALRLYAEYLRDKVRRRDPAVLAELRSIKPGERLVCSCKPRPCHGDMVVMEWRALWMEERGMSGIKKPYEKLSEKAQKARREDEAYWKEQQWIEEEKRHAADPRLPCITLWPEWAWAIAHLDKRVENRTWAAPQRYWGGWIAIHAGAHIGGRTGKPAHQDGLEGLIYTAAESGWKVEDAGISYEDVSTVLSASRDGRTIKAPVMTRAVVAIAKLTRCVEINEYEAQGWKAGPVCWELADVVTLPAPVGGIRGAQGIWRLPEELSKQLHSMTNREVEKNERRIRCSTQT